MAALLLLHLITKEERVNSTVKGLFPDISRVSENLVSPQHYSHIKILALNFLTQFLFYYSLTLKVVFKKYIVKWCITAKAIYKIWLCYES